MFLARAAARPRAPDHLRRAVLSDYCSCHNNDSTATSVSIFFPSRYSDRRRSSTIGNRGTRKVLVLPARFQHSAATAATDLKSPNTANTSNPTDGLSAGPSFASSSPQSPPQMGPQHSSNFVPPPGASAHPLSKHIVDNTLSCTTIDSHGHVINISETIPKAKFLSDNKLYARDLRSIDHTPVSIIPSILVRDQCILINLLHIKAMIKHDRVLVFDTHDDPANNSKLGLFMYDLESKLQSPMCIHNVNSNDSSGTVFVQTFEMKALESILINVVSTLETELKQHISTVNSILASLEDHIDRDQLKELLIRNKSLIKFHQKSLLIKNLLNEVLDSDDDLVGMYLTEKFENPEAFAHRSEDDHADMELLLESYYKQCDEMVQQSGQVIANVKNTEEIINIILDANRNSLMLMELKVTITTLGFTTGAFFASLYGMNLENFIEETTYGFGSVSGIIVALAVGVSVFNFAQLRNIRRVTMMGTGILQNAPSATSAAAAAASASASSSSAAMAARSAILNAAKMARKSVSSQSASSSASSQPHHHQTPLSQPRPQHHHSIRALKHELSRTDKMWALMYRLWRGHAAERRWSRKRKWELHNSCNPAAARQHDVWRWLVDSKSSHPS